MAYNEASGYDLDWVEDPPDDLKCLICLCVARDPQQHPGDARNHCGKIFCNGCITQYQKHKTTCPNCRQSLTLFLDSRSARDIKALKVKCNNLKNGCNWTGELRSLETHLQSCDYTVLPCTNKCKTDKKKKRYFYRIHLPNHVANYCPRRQYDCPHCQETGEHQERTTTHLDTCPKVKVKCPNTDCPDKIARYNLKTHQSKCAYESVSCKYADVGCEEKPLRKDLTQHENDSQLHLQVTTEQVLHLTKYTRELTYNILLLTKDVQNLTTVNSHLLQSTSLRSCTLKLTNYQQKKSDDAIFFSSPFYTSYLGYKMRLKVHAYGWGEGAGTHVSVCACLMKGDHDDTLTWPFTGSVTFELLNQLEDKNHHKKTTTFPADSDASKRVVDGERKIGLGWVKFISHTALNYNASTNTKYLKDDTLVFRVSVEAPDYKPWLDCTV